MLSALGQGFKLEEHFLNIPQLSLSGVAHGSACGPLGAAKSFSQRGQSRDTVAPGGGTKKGISEENCKYKLQAAGLKPQAADCGLVGIGLKLHASSRKLVLALICGFCVFRARFNKYSFRPHATSCRLVMILFCGFCVFCALFFKYSCKPQATSLRQLAFRCSLAGYILSHFFI